MAAQGEKFTLATINRKPNDEPTVKGHGIFGRGASLDMMLKREVGKKSLHYLMVLVLPNNQFLEHNFPPHDLPGGEDIPQKLRKCRG